jgi:multidrug efflux system membrane fusion protein
MRALFSYGLALVIVIIVAIWLGSGTLVEGGHGAGMGERPVISLFEPKAAGKLHKSEADGPDTPNPFLTIAQREAQTEGAGAPVRAVQVHTFVAKPMPIEVDVRGQTQAKATITASAETTGTIATVNVDKGQTVKKGDLLCTLDPETRQAAVTQAQSSLVQAQASVAQSQADYATNQELIKKGLATPNSARALEVAVQAAKASVAAAQAGLDNAVAELGRTKVYAKAGGIVSDPVATVGAILNPTIGAATCATIVQLDPIVFTGTVPQAQIAYARLGLEADVKTVTGQTLKGKVTYIAPAADAATRSFPVEVDLPNPGSVVKAGLTATATVDVGSAPAQLLPQSVLTLDDSGTMGVRAVDAGSKVVFYPVTIVKDAREGMYVTGLPPKVDVITVGQEFVKAGDRVKAVNDKASDSLDGGSANAQQPANSGASS